MCLFLTGTNKKIEIIEIIKTRIKLNKLVILQFIETIMKSKTDHRSGYYLLIM